MVDDVQILFPLFWRRGHVVLQSFDIGLDGGQRCTDVVRDAGDQLFAVFFLPLPLIQGILQFHGHEVEGVDHGAELILPAVADAYTQVSFLDALRGVLQFFQGRDDVMQHKAGQEPAGEQDEGQE